MRALKVPKRAFAITDPATFVDGPSHEGLIASPLSYRLRDLQLRATVTSTTLGDLTALPTELRIAALSGYLLKLREQDPAFRPSWFRRHSAEFKKLREAIVANGYESRDDPVDATVSWLFPRAFVQSSQEVDAFLDGAAEEEIIDYLEEWNSSREQIDDAVKSNNALRSNAADKAKALAAAELEEAQATGKADELALEQVQLEDELRRLNGGVALLSVESLKSMMVRPAPDLPPYGSLTDFMKVVLERNLVSIAGKPYDGPQVSNKYLQPELVAALDDLVAHEEVALREIGMWPLTLASAARTPLQQASQSNPIAAGMFSSGHIFGTAFDISFATFDKKNRAKLASILGRHGLLLPDSLATTDPNHGFLAKYVNDSEYANRVRETMLSDYYRSMAAERARQQALRGALATEKATIDAVVVALDRLIGEVQTRIAGLKSQIAGLEKKRAGLRQAIEAKKTEIATKNAMKEAERERGREWWGEAHSNRPDKDRYWERYSHAEWQSSDGCHGWRDHYENSEGREWTREGVECRADSGDGGMHLP